MWACSRCLLLCFVFYVDVNCENCERTGMQRATLGKSGSEEASQLQGWIARAFSSNSLVNAMDMTAAIQCILTAVQSLGSHVYYRKS